MMLFAEYKVTATDADGFESFSSEPIMVYPKSGEKILEMENYAPKSKLPYTNFSGKGFVGVTMTKNTAITVPVSVAAAGKYLLDVRYSNGTGPWNTD